MTTITEERRAFLRQIGRKGGLKRAQAFTSEYQRLARKYVSHESCVRNGHQGGVAYIKKYGKRHLAEKARQYRISHPSCLEQIVERALNSIGATEFEREGFIFPQSHCHVITGDFVFRKLKPHRVVYADGAAWHNGKELHPSLAECAERGTRDAHYDAYLTYRSWQILRLTQVEIEAYVRGEDGDALITKLRAFLSVGESAL